MAIGRSIGTLTFTNGIQIEADLWTDEANPGTPHEADASLLTKKVNVSDEKRIYMSVKVPSEPDDIDSSVGYGGIVDVASSFKLTLYHIGRTGTPAAARSINIYEVLGTIEEDATWDTQERSGTLADIGPLLASGDVGGDTHDFDLTAFAQNLGFRLGDTIPIMLRSSDINLIDAFGSRENGTLSQRPQVSVDYYRLPPTKMDDLKLEVYVGNRAAAHLIWSANEDVNFANYRVWYKVGASAWTPYGATLITEQGTEEFVADFSGPSFRNVVIRMRVRVTDIYGGYQDSNEVWFIRPEVTNFALTGVPPYVKAEISARVQTNTYPTTPTPVVDEKVIMDWTGEGLETGSHSIANPGNPIDENGSVVGFEYLKHRYFKAVDAPSIITPSVTVQNSLGFRSDPVDYAAPFSVTSIAPEAKLRALPTKSEAYSIHPTPGTVAVTAPSATVTGTNTQFLRDANPGDIIIIDGYDRFFIVEDVASDTSLTLDVNSPITTTGAAYMIVKNATIRLMADESIERNSNGTLDFFEFRTYDSFDGLYYNKTSGQWQAASVYNDQLSVPHIDVPMVNTYHTGTVDVVKGTKVVTGNGTTLLTNVFPGDIFMVFGSKPYVIDEVIDNTQFTLKDYYDEASGSTLNYHVFRNRTTDAVSFNNDCNVTNSFIQTDNVTNIRVKSSPQAGIDMATHLRTDDANISLTNPVDGRKKQVIEISDSDDGELVDEGRSITTIRVDGSITNCDNQDVLESLIREWVANDQMLRVFIQKIPGSDKSKYYECKLQKMPRTHSQHTYFQWNASLIVLRRVE